MKSKLVKESFEPYLFILESKNRRVGHTHHLNGLVGNRGLPKGLRMIMICLEEVWL